MDIIWIYANPVGTFSQTLPLRRIIIFFYNSDYKKFENKFFEDSLKKEYLYSSIDSKAFKPFTPSSSLLDIGSALESF